MSLFTRFIIFREGIDPELVETCKKFNASLNELELDDESGSGAAGSESGSGSTGSGAAGAAGAASIAAAEEAVKNQVALVGTDSTYSYTRFIKSPTDMEITGTGTLDALDKDIQGLESYVKLLVEGNSSASKMSDGPLGNKFFVKTAAKCNDLTGNVQDRHFYVNNVPLGKNKIDGTEYKVFKGLIPGMLQNLDVLNPDNISAAFSSGDVPSCMSITMETIDSNNIVSNATHFVTLTDIAVLDPCLFPIDPITGKKTNPQTKYTCVEGFTSNVDDEKEKEKEKEKDIIQEDIKTDYISQAFLGSFSLFGIYLLYMALKRTKTGF